MKGDSQDRRVKRTQRLLAEALMSLTLERGYEAVTVREITERADVGYATFFRHYPDKDALLQEVLNVVLDELLDLLRPQRVGVDAGVMGTLLFRYIQEHEAICRVLLSSRGSAALLQRVIEAGTRNVLAEHRPRADGVVPAEVAAHHMIAASIALIQWWLDHNLPYPPERMGQIYDALITGPAQRAAFEP